MKRLFFVLLLVPIHSFCQSYKEKRETDRLLRESSDTIAFPKPFIFTFIDSPGISKAPLYARCFQYLATKVSNMNWGNQMHDSLSGKIVIPNMTSNYSEDYRYTLTVDVREGKYRCKFEDFYDLENLNLGKVPFDTVAEMKGMWLGAGTKHQHWQVEKYHMREEVKQLFAEMRAFVAKRDDF